VYKVLGVGEYFIEKQVGMERELQKPYKVDISVTEKTGNN